MKEKGPKKLYLGIGFYVPIPILFFVLFFSASFNRKEKIRYITLLSHFLTDKRVDLRYNTLCIYMWTYVHTAKNGPNA